ncbi:MAG: hypothetical protein ACTSVB_10530 [Candidatus Heimdallarchaeaceae archaeon]
MRRIRVIQLFWRRNFKLLIPSAMITLFIFSIVAIMIISVSATYNFTLEKKLDDVDFFLSASVPQGGMEQLSFDEILSTFSSISAKGLNISYSIIIYSIYETQGEQLLVPIIGLDPTIMINGGFSQGDIIGAMEFGINNTVNISKAFPYYLKNEKQENYPSYNLSFSQKINETMSGIISYLLSETMRGTNFDHLYDYAGTSYKESQYFILCNISMISYLMNFFNMDSKELNAIIIENITENSFKPVLVDKINKRIQEHKKIIFQICVNNGFNLELVYFYSPVYQLLQDSEVYTEYEIFAIQRLSIANIVIIIVLLSTLELGVYQLVKDQGKLLKTKGLSVRQIFFLIFTIDILLDLSIICFSLVVFSLFIIGIKLPLTTIVSLVETYGLFFIVIVLSKIINLLVFTKRQLSNKKYELKYSKRIPIQKSTIGLFFVFVVILVQTYSILDPLFYFKLLNRNTTIAPKQIRITIDIFSIILILLMVINYFRNESFEVLKKTEKRYLSVKKLLGRLFSKEVKMFKVQQLVIICFYSLLFYLIIFKTVNETYIELNKNTDSWDAFFIDINYHIQKDFTYKKVANLSQAIPQIKEICPSTGEWGYVSYNSSVISTEVKIINTTSYLSKNLGWNHFIGMKTYKINNSLLREVKGKSIVINRALAERALLREGDKIYLELEIGLDDYKDRYKKVVEDELTIIGIVDTISTSEDYDEQVIIDISLFLDMCEKANIEPEVSSFYVDFFFSNNATEEKRKIELEYYISLILNELNYSRTNVDIYTIYTESMRPMATLYSQNIAETFFIYVEIIICTLFIPTTILILSQSTVERLLPNLVKIGARGYSDKKIRREYARKVYMSLINSILLGLFLGLIVGTIHTKNKLPIVYLAQNITKIYAEIGFYFILCALGGILSTLLIIHFSSKKMRTIIIEKRRLIIKNEAHRN